MSSSRPSPPPDTFHCNSGFGRSIPLIRFRGACDADAAAKSGRGDPTLCACHLVGRLRGDSACEDGAAIGPRTPLRRAASGCRSPSAHLIPVILLLVLLVIVVVVAVVCASAASAGLLLLRPLLHERAGRLRVLGVELRRRGEKSKRTSADPQVAAKAPERPPHLQHGCGGLCVLSFQRSPAQPGAQRRLARLEALRLLRVLLGRELRLGALARLLAEALRRRVRGGGGCEVKMYCGGTRARARALLCWAGLGRLCKASLTFPSSPVSASVKYTRAGKRSTRLSK